MTDLALRWDNNTFGADLALIGPSLATDEGLKTAIIVSLFTDSRARDDDPLPAPGDRRGWWGDAAPKIRGDRIGSRLWLLSREKRLQSVLNRARDYAQEALAWLVEDGIAQSVTVTTEAQGEDILAIGVEIIRPGAIQRQRFDFTWEKTADAV